jgi:magnesium transporter
MGLFTKRYHPPGTAPGTLQPPVTAPAKPPSMRLIAYGEDDFIEREDVKPDDHIPWLDTKGVTWVHIQGDPSLEMLSHLGTILHLHPLIQEDVINTGQRPKFELYDTDQLFVILSQPLYDGRRIETVQVSLYLRHNLVLSFHHGSQDPFEPTRRRLRDAVGRIRQRGADYLLYSLIDTIIDCGFPLLDHLGNELELLEEQVLARPSRQSLELLHGIRREVVLLRRMLWPQRDVLNDLLREGETPLSEGTHIYFRDCYDHSIQIIELLETYREITTSLLDLHLSITSNRLGEIMKVLTVFASIFIPLTFITGIYGMNFNNPDSPWAMPELAWYWGYPAVLGGMIAVGLGLLYLFRRKGWF